VDDSRLRHLYQWHEDCRKSVHCLLYAP
jgi:hypothetical protein